MKKFKVGDSVKSVKNLPVGTTLWPDGNVNASWYLIWDGDRVTDSSSGFPYPKKSGIDRRIIRSLPGDTYTLELTRDEAEALVALYSCVKYPAPFEKVLNNLVDREGVDEGCFQVFTYENKRVGIQSLLVKKVTS